ncbi:hypothetical protein PISMIDRAFT_684462, partial [Pisolithus microcarpus 441]
MMSVKTSAMVGRNAGSSSQHLQQILHHGSVRREHVSSRLGRAGFCPLQILMPTVA